ncbi:MAG: DUF4430 domain-containing protein [Lachnospiraceae bacterium]|nr:DUF4430 domain-containing protein [Lachnospiraceae bacterium]
MRKRILSLLLTVLMVIGLMPSAVFAATSDPHQNQVHVIIENTTFHEGMEGWEEAGQFWDDVHVDTWVTLGEDSSMMSCIEEACGRDVEIEIVGDYYISRIDGLGEFDGGPMSGWMGTLNDWFVNDSFAAFTVENGKLSAGDEIRVMYTVNGYGEDLGGFWGDINTTLKAIEFSEGTLNEEFDPDTLNYVLTVPSDTEDIQITPTAANKNFQVFMEVGSVMYKRSQRIPVVDGTEIFITVGAGETMNQGATPTIYSFTIQKEGSATVDPNPDPGPNPNPNPNPEEQIPEELSALNTKILANYNTTKAYLTNQTATNDATVGFVGGEWLVIGLARSEATPANAAFYKNYYKNVEAYVRANINADERLHKSKATDNERVILALTAIGKDPTNVAGHNLLNGLNSMKYLKKQGINGVIWALLAFDSHNYAIPNNSNSADAVTRDKLIDHILSVQTPERGWTLSGKKADPDMTGMAIQALAPYYNKRADVKEAVDAALNKMAEFVNDRGGLSSYGIENSESVSQIVVALTSLGINPLTDARFIKNGHSIMETFDRFFVEGGGYKHILNGNRDGMATEQAFYALASYSRLLNGKTSLYNMSDVQTP